MTREEKIDFYAKLIMTVWTLVTRTLVIIGLSWIDYKITKDRAFVWAMAIGATVLSVVDISIENHRKRYMFWPDIYFRFVLARNHANILCLTFWWMRNSIWRSKVICGFRGIERIDRVGEHFGHYWIHTNHDKSYIVKSEAIEPKIGDRISRFNDRTQLIPSER
jgi:hypothetical protein